MTEIQECQSNAELQSLLNLVDIETKICNILGIKVDNFKTGDTVNKINLKEIESVLRIIYNCFLKDPLTIPKLNYEAADKSQLLQQFYQKEDYERIQDLLQKQENKTRLNLRKQFQFKEYQNSIIDELNEEKSLNRQINKQLSKLNQEIQQKDLQIRHLRNQLKALQRSSKNHNNFQTLDFKHKILTNYNLSNPFLSLLNEAENYDKRTPLSKELQKNKAKKAGQFKQKAVFALYNHKKHHSDTLNIFGGLSDRIKRVSSIQKSSAKKTMDKDLHSIEISNKKSAHTRRKSQEYIKKTPTQIQSKQSKALKKKKQIQQSKNRFL